MPSELIVEVTQVNKILPHPNADRLELAIVKGWQCVVQKGMYWEGDKVIYIPIDSVLSQATEEKIFPPESKVTLNKRRVKTIKLRGQFSQGLVAPLGLFEISPDTPVDTDVCDLLGITKYQQPIKNMPNGMSGKKVTKEGTNPHFYKYTKINHLHNFPNSLGEEPVVMTEKIHGSNWRAGYTKLHKIGLIDRVFRWAKWLLTGDKDPQLEFVYGSHNVQLQNRSKKIGGFYPTNVYYEIVEKYQIEQKLKELFPKDDVVLYGEVYGDGIQKNYPYDCKQGERKLVLIDVMFDGREYGSHFMLKRIADRLGIPIAPVIFTGPFNRNKLEQYISGPSVLCPDQKVREGVVVRKMFEKGFRNQRHIYKWISPEYLMGKGNTEWA